MRFLKTFLSKTRNGFVRFVATPASPKPLAVLRIGLAAVLLLQAFSMAGDLHELFGNRGVVQKPDDGFITNPLVISIDWFVPIAEQFGGNHATAVKIVFFTYIGGLMLLLMGYHTRIAAIIAWLMHLALNSSGHAIIYGVDAFAIIALFYCVVMPVGAVWSMDEKRKREKGKITNVPSVEARIGLRVLQIHMCIVYLTSGIHKAMGEQWWNGEAVWRALNMPSLAQFDFTWLAAVPFIPLLLCWGTLFIEIGYAFLIWPTKWRIRTMMAWGAVSLHAGIAVGMGLWSFSGVMIALNLAAFITPSAPRTEELVATDAAVLRPA